MADETKGTTTATETPYESPEMADIKAHIAEQDAIISAAREELKELRKAKRRQARLDEKERERRAREKEQREALDLLHALRSSTLRKNDGTSVNAYEYVTGLVTALGVANGSRRGSDGSVSEPSDSR